MAFGCKSSSHDTRLVLSDRSSLATLQAELSELVSIEDCHSTILGPEKFKGRYKVLLTPRKSEQGDSAS